MAPSMPAGRDVGVLQGAGRPQPQVVAVHRDVDGAAADADALDLGDGGGDPVGQGHAASGDSQHDQVVRALVALEDLVGDARQRARDVRGVEYDA